MDFDAVFAVTDVIAIDAMRALEDNGLTVPGDIAVVGFDDVPLAREVTPPLTTIRQPIYDIASMAMSMLVEELIPGNPSELTIEVPTELVVRHSTACCGETN